MLDFVVCPGKSKVTETGSWLLFIFKRKIPERSWKLTFNFRIVYTNMCSKVDPF